MELEIVTKLLLIFYIFGPGVRMETNLCKDDMAIMLCRDNSKTGEYIHLDTLGAPAQQKVRCTCSITSAELTKFSVSPMFSDPGTIKLVINGRKINSSTLAQTYFANIAVMTITFTKDSLGDYKQCFSVSTGSANVHLNATCYKGTLITEQESAAPGKTRIIIGSAGGIIVIIIILFVIAVRVCKRRIKERKCTDINENSAYDSPGYDISVNAGYIGIDEYEASRVQNCINNKPTDDYEGVGYAVFMISDEASLNPHAASQVDTELSEYNHLHEIPDKPKSENVYNVPESPDESSDNEASHYNRMCEVKRKLAAGNVYGMPVTNKKQNKSQMNVYEDARVSYEPVQLQYATVKPS